MVKSIIKSLIITVVLGFLLFYFMLPPINIHAVEFSSYTAFEYTEFFTSKAPNVKFKHNGVAKVVLGVIPAIVIAVLLSNFINSPLFQANSYAHRIDVGTGKEFAKEVFIESRKLASDIDRINVLMRKARIRYKKEYD